MCTFVFFEFYSGNKSVGVLYKISSRTNALKSKDAKAVAISVAIGCFFSIGRMPTARW